MAEVQAISTGTIRYRRLGESDLDAVYALHRLAIDAVGRPDLIKPESKDFFRRILSGGGLVTGAFEKDRLLGYGVLQLDLPPSEDARPELGLATEVRLAKLAGASVLPDAWGAGIHDALIRMRIDDAIEVGVRHLYATAAPGNFRSWENLVEAGFSVRGLIQKYGGHLRYLLHRDLEADPAGTGDGEWCMVSDVERQKALLSDGRAGLRGRRRDDGERELWYGRRA